MLEANQLPLAPLGAGDLIDRTIRLYRRHFWALIRASAPPVVLSAVGTVLFTVGSHEVGLTDSEGLLALYIILIVLGVLLLLGGSLLLFIVMGGASRNLVAHLLRNEPVSARVIYRNVRSRFKGLLGATLAISLWVAMSFSIAFVAWLLVFLLWYSVIVMALMTFAFSDRSGVMLWVTGAAGLVCFATTLFGMLWLFFWLAGRVAYVPQVLLVEGRSVMDSISRSMRLARGNVRRLMAMFVFTTFATYSALMLLLIPLGWYGYLHGVDPFALDPADQPLWYAIGYQVVAQCSSILLTPVWMLGLSLLYVDERVRHEGYDLELMAVRIFGEMPSLPTGMVSPLSPALAAEASATLKPDERAGHTVLGLTGKPTL